MTAPANIRKWQDPTDMTSWDGIQGLADKAVKAWEQFFLGNWRQLRPTFDAGAFIQAFEAGDMSAAMDAFSDPGPEVIAEQIGAFENMAGKLLGGAGNVAGATFNMRFNMKNPETIRFLRTYSFDLIQGTGKNERSAIAGILRDAFENGGHPRQTAPKIARVLHGTLPIMTGLDQRRATALQNYANGLWKESGGLTAALKLPQDQFRKLQEAHSKKIEAYGKRLLQDRALTIARTETIRTAAMGQQMLWRQAVQDGLIDQTNTVRVWIVTKDDRTCDYCLQLQDKVVALEGTWTSTITQQSGQDQSFTALTPPLHPRCRCAMGLRFGQAPLQVVVHEPQTQAAPSAQVQPQAPAPGQKDPWAEKMQARIKQGVNTDHEAIEIGRQVAEEIDRHLGAETAPYQQAVVDAHAAFEVAKKERIAYADHYQKFKLWDDPHAEAEMQTRVDRYRQTQAARDAAEKAYRDFYAAGARKIRQQVLARIRPMGLPAGVKEHPLTLTNQGDKRKAAARSLHEALNCYPAAWVEESIKLGPMLLDYQNGRGYYSSNRPHSKIVLNGSFANSVHELGHRMEDVFGTRIRGLERQFYERRTAGEDLRWLGKGYRKDEKNRPDKWRNPYMGKDYRPLRSVPEMASWEIVTMGWEGEWAGKYGLEQDPEFRHFILGILAGV